MILGFSWRHYLERLWTRFSPFLVLLVAFGIEFFRIGARTFHGDELGSVYEAQSFGLNANSLPYFALLRLWVELGVNEFWLRSLSAFAAVAFVAISFIWARKLFGASTARMTALLLATSPFLVVYAQQVRFYAIGLLAAALAILAFVKFLERSTPRRLVLWIVAGVLSIGALLMNGLLMLGQGATLFILTRRWRSRDKIFLSIGILALSVALIGVPVIRQTAFNAIAFYTNAQTRYAGSRGWMLAQVAKIPLTFFFFAFGESVYPLTWWLVVPGVFIFGFAAILGLIRLRQNPRAFWFILATMSVSLALMYLVFDPLAPPGLQGAAPRYLAFLLPLFCLAMGAGAQKKTGWLVVPLLAVNLGSLMSFWIGDWAYTDDLVNWRQVKTWVGTYVTAQTEIILDGQSQQLANYYFPADWHRRAMSGDPSKEDIANLNSYTRVILLSFNFHLEGREISTRAIEIIARQFDVIAVQSRYPLFIYVFDRKASAPRTWRVDPATGAINTPVEIYGLEFQDLRLPISLKMNDRVIQSYGAFGLAGLSQPMTRTLALEAPLPARSVWLFSHLVGTSLETGTTFAILNVISEKGAMQSFPLRVGIETAAWNRMCLPGACTNTYSWRKLFALLGTERYPDAWEEFDASIFAARLELNQATQIRAIEFQWTSASGVLYIWGAALEN